MIVRPDAAHSVVPDSAPWVNGASMRTDTDLPVASAICEASVRFQIRS